MTMLDPTQSQSSIMKGAEVDENLLQLRSRATELLLREDWTQYISLYSNFISHSKTKDPNSPNLVLALSNRAEARYKLKDLASSLSDCNEALQIDPTHLKALICKGKVLLDLNRYSQACECFQTALSLKRSEAVADLLDKCKKLDSQSRTGAIDISEWVASDFCGGVPELAEFVGAVEVRRGENGRRGVFVTKSIEAGSPLVVSKAVVLGRGILPEAGSGSDENARMVMWKDFVDRILDVSERCGRTLFLINLLSTGNEDEKGELIVPDMAIFRPEAEEERFVSESREPDLERILNILDVNCLNEEAVSAKVFGKKTSGCCGVGLWILPSFVNHSCSPNVRRLHIGEWLVVYASRDLKEGEEIAFAYFDVLLPLNKRRELSKRWGFQCDCERCKFEEEKGEVREMKSNEEDVVVRLEEHMKKNMLGKKEKGFLRASFWAGYVILYESERLMRRLGRRIPTELVVAESVMEAVGGDERVLKAALGSLKRNGNGGWVEIQKMMKMGRGVYGRVMKKKAMRNLLEQFN